MRMILNVTMPPEPFNTLVREGKAGEILGRILDEMKPEAIYFTERDGQRGAIAIVDVSEPSQVPGVCEPWFLSFNAQCRLRIAMSGEELQKAGLGEIAERWG
jgi:hypothetical protein